MTEALRNYLLAVVAAALLSSILLSLVPKGGVRRTLSFLCGLILLLTVLGPLADLDGAALAEQLARMRLETERSARAVEDGSRELEAALIKEQAEAYIWDKAAELGISLERVSVGVDVTGEVPALRAVEVTAACTPAQRQRIQAVIERDLGIARERQEWGSE